MTSADYLDASAARLRAWQDMRLSVPFAAPEGVLTPSTPPAAEPVARYRMPLFPPAALRPGSRWSSQTRLQRRA